MRDHFPSPGYWFASAGVECDGKQGNCAIWSASALKAITKVRLVAGLLHAGALCLASNATLSVRSSSVPSPSLFADTR